MIYNGKVDGVDNFQLKTGEAPPTGTFVYDRAIYPKPVNNSIAVKSDGSRLIFNGSAWTEANVKVGKITAGDIEASGDITSAKTVKGKRVRTTDADGLVIPSSTASSTKKMKVKIVDDGTVSAEEEA